MSTMKSAQSVGATVAVELRVFENLALRPLSIELPSCMTLEELEDHVSESQKCIKFVKKWGWADFSGVGWLKPDNTPLTATEWKQPLSAFLPKPSAAADAPPTNTVTFILKPPHIAPIAAGPGVLGEGADEVDVERLAAILDARMSYRSRVPVLSPVSDAELGQIAWHELVAHKLIVEFSPTDMAAAPIFTVAQHSRIMREVRKAKTTNAKETCLVKEVTPRLCELRSHDAPASDPCRPLLVNSERFQWLEDSTREQAKICHMKPDLLRTWYPFVTLKGRTGQQGDPGVDSRYVFGKLAHPRLQQIQAVKEVYEAKSHKLTIADLGKLDVYHQLLDGPCYGMLFGPEEFWLYETFRGKPISLIKASWTQPGTVKVLQGFFGRASEPYIIPTLRRMLADLKIHFAPQPFLGAGAFGYVFRVQDESGASFALKFVPGEQNRSRVIAEICMLRELSNRGLRCVATPVKNSLRVFDEGFGYLMTPVGVPYNVASKARIAAAFEALKSIHALEYAHGDARLDNLIEFDGEPVWIDAATTVGPVTIESFRRDVKTLAESILHNEKVDHIFALCDVYTPTDPALLRQLVDGVYASRLEARGPAKGPLPSRAVGDDIVEEDEDEEEEDAEDEEEGNV